MAVDPGKLEALMGKVAADLGAAMAASVAVLGDRLGLYQALVEAGPCTSAQLAAKTGLNERNLREWLSAQAASGYIDYDASGGRFTLSAEQQAVFADEDSPAFMAGGFDVISAMFLDEPKVAEAFKTGRGLGWHERCPCLFRGTERFFRPGYNTNLVSSWIPALDGVEAKLKSGARVADVGCGHGASTIVMAKAYPNARFTGFDYHGPSIARAREAAQEAGVSDRVTFETASAKEFGGEGYDLIAMFDSLHDMGDPVGAARHIRTRLAPGGAFMLVEPNAADELKDNLENPFSRMFYSASTMVCTPVSQSQEVGLALGAAAGPRRLTKVANEAGFTHVRRVAETPINMVLELKP